MDFDALVQGQHDLTSGLGLNVDYFDGVRPLRQAIQIRVQGQELLGLGEGGEVFRVPLRDLRWPHLHQRGQRSLHLPGDAVVNARDAQAWDAWVAQQDLHCDHVGWLQTHGTSLAAAVLIVVAVAWGMLRWGLPLGAEWVAGALPDSVAQSMGESTLDELQESWLKPTTLTRLEQAEWQQDFESAAAAWAKSSQQDLPPYRLHFAAGGALGANALALPSGDVMITDELIEALEGHRKVVLGVLAHELTHVREQHVMRQVVQASLLGVLVSAVTGDFSAVVTTAVTLAGASHYSREFEREADDGAVAFMRANGWSPAEMLVLFDRLAALRDSSSEGGWGIAFASHPSDAERRLRFAQAAGR